MERAAVITMTHFDINNPNIASRLITQNDLAFAFPSLMPIVPGHTLVCPKRVVTTMDELTNQELIAIMQLRKALREAMIKTFDAEGFNYAWNEGNIAGQTVPHLHLHMLPRKAGDTGITTYEPRSFLYRPGERDASPEEELSAVAKLIKKHIS